MAYRALYRQYRPASFSGVVGQEHITTTLRHQVESGHVAHAYLFCGSRGTGKTTSARILARAVNCLSPLDGEPCGKCAACVTAENESNGDIVEIDAASNNRVDDVRALIENVQFAPLSLRYRVFIIDEAHMITGAAFNALLKTLEEPPAHVMFILATTEPQKLPATIISRCQRFDFHRLSVGAIVENLKTVLHKAGASIQEEGLMLIARAADGGMRDALSLADQCLAFCGDKVSTKDVYDVLGSMEEGFLFDMAEALLGSNAPKALSMLDQIVKNGRDLSVFCQDLAGHFRALMLAKTCGLCEELLDCTHDAMLRYLEQAKNASSPRLLFANEQLLKVMADMRYLARPRALLEAALIRICRPEDSLSLLALEARVDRLEGLSPCLPGDALKEETAGPVPPEETEAPAQWEQVPPPPWEEETPPPAVPAKPQPPAAPQSPLKAPSAPRPATAVSGGNEPESLWTRVLSSMQSQNVMIYMLAKAGSALRLEDDTLVVGFPAGEQAQYNSVTAAVNFNRLQGVLEGIRPGTRLSLVKADTAPASEEATRKAKALFGDKLIIE